MFLSEVVNLGCRVVLGTPEGLNFSRNVLKVGEVDKFWLVKLVENHILKLNVKMGQPALGVEVVYAR